MARYKRIIRSFPPIEDENSKILILGSMPGEASLRARQYYAHERNAFWTIMGKLLGFDPRSDYSEKTLALKLAGIALWDVIHSCRRHGSSLDSKIDGNSVVPNDFRTFFRRHPKIRRLFFNGSMAETTFKKFVMTKQKELFYGVKFYRLPSTSPAHASMDLETKFERWKKILGE